MAIDLYEYKREFNKIIQIKTKIHLIGADIFFLKNCMKHKVTPKFARLVNKNKTYNKHFSKAIEYANYKFLKLEIINHYRNSGNNSLEIQSYNLHLNSAKNINTAQWDILQEKLFTVVEHKYEIKKFNQNKKFAALINEKLKTNKDQKIDNTKEWEDNLVKNHTEEIFSNEELNILKQGLKSSYIPSRIPLEDIIVGIELGIKKINL